MIKKGIIKAGDIMSEKIFEEVQAIIKEKLGTTAEIKLDSNFNQDLKADSLDVVEIVMALEAKYDIKMENTQTDGLQTVGDVVALINDLTSKK